MNELYEKLREIATFADFPLGRIAIESDPAEVVKTLISEARRTVEKYDAEQLNK